jgi:hypothetical protein
MRKNQKYSNEETCPFMPDLIIQTDCQAGVPGQRVMEESGLSQGKFCSRENLSVKTFSYWYKKYKKENGLSAVRNKEVSETFITVKVSGDRTATVTNEGYNRIEVSFPNGVQLSCPAEIDISQ